MLPFVYLTIRLRILSRNHAQMLKASAFQKRQPCDSSLKRYNAESFFV
jgi:hypothetical protein